MLTRQQITIVYSLTAIEHHIGCKGSDIQTIDVSAISTAPMDSSTKRVLIVLRAHLIT